ncbi:sel1 repeat family protein [Vibrio hepatarius]|uniref:sel1 repeat family protein n=1 Tax=Vibrio hepatarius TaxID=171383 RepID=UPI00142DB8D3|nr:sel1 repeat family protein [Vibrio hepatarius]NIY85409.1 sel1 repeat family protein [Vibrio hepatarius]
MKQTLFIFLLLCSGKLWAISPVEQGIRLFNQQEYQQAQQVLQQQSDQGSAYATFWLAMTQYKNRQQFEAGETFLKAANLGDPWAMGVLSGYEYYVNNPCGFLGWPCDEKWRQLAIEGWKKEAEKGNGKALLQLQFFTNQWRNYVPVLGRYLIDKKYIEALESGGFNASYYLTQFSDVPKDEKIQYLRVAANHGYAPAMMSLYYYLLEPDTLDEALEWNLKAIKLGYAKAARLFYYVYSQGEKDSDGNIIIQPDIKKAYYYNKISGALGGEKEDDLRITERMRVKDQLPVVDENGRPVFEVLITKEEQAELDKQVAEFVKDIKPNMFLDETSLELF